MCLREVSEDGLTVDRCKAHTVTASHRLSPGSLREHRSRPCPKTAKHRRALSKSRSANTKQPTRGCCFGRSSAGWLLLAEPTSSGCANLAICKCFCRTKPLLRNGPCDTLPQAKCHKRQMLLCEAKVKIGGIHTSLHLCLFES